MIVFLRCRCSASSILGEMPDKSLEHMQIKAMNCSRVGQVSHSRVIFGAGYWQ